MYVREPNKGQPFNRKYIFQPLMFRGYVNFLGSIHFILALPLTSAMTFVGHDTFAACTDNGIQWHHGELEPAFRVSYVAVVIAISMPSLGTVNRGDVCFLEEIFRSQVGLYHLDIYPIMMDVDGSCFGIRGMVQWKSCFFNHNNSKELTHT